MIDFRYHVVSLISVFLALAVGIVLGAGPLRESLGDQLAGQVEQLRTEQEDLRQRNDALVESNDQLASFLTEAGPEMVAGSLRDQRIVILTDHTSTRTALDRTGALLDAAGARTTARVTLQPGLWDPQQEQRRVTAVRAISRIAPVVLEHGTSNAEKLAGAVVTLLERDTDEDLTESLRSQVWEVLIEEQLVTVDGDLTPLPDGMIFAAANPEDLQVSGEEDTAATERAQQMLLVHSAMLAELSRSGIPAVVAGVTPGNDSAVSILRTVRGDSRFSGLSTTDRLQAVDGPLLAVLALVEQTHGGAGDYGTATDADARVPSLPQGRAPLGKTTQPSDGGGEG